jgi:hypothetical protein
MNIGFKKSLYLFLSSLLGVMLFLVLHRVLIFLYLLMASAGYQPFLSEVSSLTFLGLEYLSLILTLLLGAWYGIWLGLYWYKKVYEDGESAGLVEHLTLRYWPKRKNQYGLQAKIEAAKKHLENNMWELEDLAKTIPAAAPSPAPIKKQVVRKRAPRKLSKMA